MEFTERKIDGTFEIQLKPYVDERGYFMRTFDEKIFENLGIKNNWVQENHSKSVVKNVIRGLHFQLPPYTETKLVRCIRGKVLDVFVDLRDGSKSFGHWDSIVLSDENKKMILIPRGFAHGFCTLSEISEVTYKVDNYYSPEFERGLIWNDENIKIKWPTNFPFLSEKDKKNISFEEFIKNYKAISV